MDDRGVPWPASEPVGQPDVAADRRGASAPGVVVQPGCRGPAASRDMRISLTSEMRMHLDRGQLADGAGAAPTVEAEWALWGKDASQTAYHVLRCSDGTFELDDFREIITRYVSGVQAELPQYTVCWIPGDQHRPPYLAVAIHELADPDPGRSGGRSRAVGGREIEYVRLFCVKYEEMAKLGLSYTELIESVKEYQLDGDTTSLTVPLRPETELFRFTAQFRELAENVAALLLTTRPVCVLGAEGCTAVDRLRFIELVMSLLPYGLRTRLSASTWASSTAQHLKLRLYFANARRDDGDRTSHVTWGVAERLDLSAPEHDAVRLYLRWLRDVGSGAAPALVGVTAPLLFTDADIRRVVAHLPTDRSVTETLEELGNSLRKADTVGVRTAVDRLRRHMASQHAPADRAAYRQVIFGQKLLKDRQGLPPGIKESTYRVLFQLAFDTPLTYDVYCEITNAIGGPPHGALRSAMLSLHFDSFIPFVLTAKAGPDPRDDELADMLANMRIEPTLPIDEVAELADSIRSEHRPVAYDFAVYYLRDTAENPWRELRLRGYLAETLEVLFPDNVKAQCVRLERTLRFGYGRSLSRAQIDDLFALDGLYPTVALEQVTRKLAGSPRADRHIAQQAALTRLSTAGYVDDAMLLTRGAQGRSRFAIHERVQLVPKATIRTGIAILLVIVVFAIYILIAAHF
jgi:hypothetical protein